MRKVYYLLPIAILLAIVIGIELKFGFTNIEKNIENGYGIYRSTQEISEAELIRDAVRKSDAQNLAAVVALFLETTNESLTCDSSKVYKSNEVNRQINGTGWLPIDLTKIAGGSPFGSLPVDPLNPSTNYYSFACDPKTNTYEINVFFESSATEILEYAKNDNGNNPAVFETGTNLNLIK